MTPTALTRSDPQLKDIETEVQDAAEAAMQRLLIAHLRGSRNHLLVPATAAALAAITTDSSSRAPNSVWRAGRPRRPERWRRKLVCLNANRATHRLDTRRPALRRRPRSVGARATNLRSASHPRSPGGINRLPAGLLVRAMRAQVGAVDFAATALPGFRAAPRGWCTTGPARWRGGSPWIAFLAVAVFGTWTHILSDRGVIPARYR